MDLEEIKRKSVVIELKEDGDGEEGSFTARIATLNVVDKDNEITKPGAFPKGKEVLISAYQHGSWMGSLPIGKATIREEDEEELYQFFIMKMLDLGYAHWYIGQELAYLAHTIDLIKQEVK